MANSETLPQNVLDAIASKLATHQNLPFSALKFGGTGPALGAGPAVPLVPSLGSTFSVWMLEAADVIGEESLKPNPDLTKLVKNLGVWHHQIMSGVGKAVAYARSKPLGPDPASWSIRELSSDLDPQIGLASNINEAIEFINGNITDATTVRLLTVPSYQVHAFLVFDDADRSNQKVVLIKAPANIALKAKTVMSSKEFLTGLASSPHISGLIGDIR